MILNTYMMAFVDSTLILVILTAVLCGAEIAHKYDIHRKILGDNYDPSLIPWTFNKPLVINTTFKLEYIIKLTEKDQILTSVIWNSFEWYDSRLTWDPSELYGVESIRLPPEMVWKPDVMLQNSVGTSAYLSKLDPTSIVLIYYTGQMAWYPFHTAETYCEIDAYLFPFDTQECHFWIYSWAYPNSMLQLRPVVSAVPDLTPNSTEWAIISTNSSIDNTFEVNMTDGTYNHVRHTVVIKRQITFFNVVILTPCVILTLLTLLLFVLPVDTGDRMELGLAIWTSLVLFLLMVNDSIPSSSGRFHWCSVCKSIIMIM